MKEYGRIGQKRWEGVFNEEFLPELSGIRGIKTYREMLDNDDTIGAIKMCIRDRARYYKEHQLEILLLGRRKADGNYVGKDNIYTNSSGITRYSPLAEWRLSLIHI